MWFILLACSGSPDAPKAKKAAPAPAAAPAAPLPPPPPKESVYGDHYFVILSSKIEQGHEAPGLATIKAHPELAITPERFPSTGFKGLMPCYEIVVAGALKEKAAATDLSAKLTALGVENYVKNAGAWVGARPELDDYCSALAKPAAGDAAVAVMEPGLGARIAIEEAVAAPLLAAAPPVKALGTDGNLWESSLPNKSVGSWTIGQKVAGLAADKVLACKVTGFVAGVAGQPHFGWLQTEGGPPSTPGCGEAALYMKVKCEGGEPLLVLAEGRKGAIAALTPVVEATPGAPAPAKKVKDPRAVWMAKPPAGVAKAKEAAKLAAAQQNVKPEHKWTFAEYNLGEAAYGLVRYEISSGQGNWMCGGDDIHEAVLGLIGADGKELVPMVSAPSEDVLGVFDTDDDGKPELLLHDQITGSRRLLSTTGERAWPRAYCDCAC